MGKISSDKRDLNRNGSGYLDTTASKAISKTDKETERFHKLLETIFSICELSGFHLESRIEVRDKKTGKVWR